MNEEPKRSKRICMVGTDHTLAPAGVRSVFTLASEERDAVLPLLRVRLGATGVVLLSTCNRTELWASFDAQRMPVRSLTEEEGPAADDPLMEALCAAYNVDPAEYAPYFAHRQDEAAVDHLFHVACGLRSAIVAEDQVVSQVKRAIATSREAGVADSCLEVLFRQAVTTAKQVKSGVRFTRAYTSAVEQALALLESGGTVFSHLTCMVIGNGEYGRLAASTLVERGARVMVTVRQYSHGSVQIPHGCESIPYEQRYEHLCVCDVVMSATTSPHFTLVSQKFQQALSAGQRIQAFDLAIPSDIDPEIASIEGCSLYDIDRFGSGLGSENDQAIADARKVIAAGTVEFWDWMRRKEQAGHVKPPTAAYFPLFVDLSDRHVVFVGGGTIALRRIRTLLQFVDDIVVYAPDFSPELERFAADGIIELVRKRYEVSVLDGADIVMACTNDGDLNNQIWEECKRRGILVNVCSDRFKCDFFFPGVAVQDNVVVGVTAGGKNHRQVKQLRARIQRLMEEEDI